MCFNKIFYTFLKLLKIQGDEGSGFKENNENFYLTTPKFNDKSKKNC